MWWRKSQRKYPREKEKLFIHFVSRHNTLSTQIHSKYERNIFDSEPLDGENWGHFPHHPAFSTLISGFRSLKFYWLYKTVVTSQFCSIQGYFYDPYFVILFWVQQTTKRYSLGLKSSKLGVLFCMQNYKHLWTTMQHRNSVMGLEYWGRQYWIQWPVIFDASCCPDTDMEGGWQHHQDVRVRQEPGW